MFGSFSHLDSYLVVSFLFLWLRHSHFLFSTPPPPPPLVFGTSKDIKKIWFWPFYLYLTVSNGLLNFSLMNYFDKTTQVCYKIIFGERKRCAFTLYYISFNFYILWHIHLLENVLRVKKKFRIFFLFFLRYFSIFINFVNLLSYFWFYKR